jgi:transcriptional regulator with XRE-family HTH domain
MEKKEFNKQLGAFVRHKRLELKLNQPQLGDRVGIDFQYISRVERGLIAPTLFWLSKLSTALDMSLEDFVREFSDFASLRVES